MEKYYNKSRIIMLILAVVVSLIMFINEDISFKLYGTFFIAIVTLVASYLVTPISKKMIERGDKLEKKLWRILYYVLMLPITLVLIILVCLLIGYIDDLRAPEKYQDMGAALSHAFEVIALYVIFFILFLLPFVQSLIVLFLRNREKKRKN